MPRFKPIHKGLKLLPVDFDRQISHNNRTPSKRIGTKLELT